LPILAGATGPYNLTEVERNLKKKKMPEAISLYQQYLPKLRLEIAALPSRATVISMAGAIAEKDVRYSLRQLRAVQSILLQATRRTLST
jgi:hypothetical protein